jgi:alkaline phosphatase
MKEIVQRKWEQEDILAEENQGLIEGARDEPRVLLGGEEKNLRNQDQTQTIRKKQSDEHHSL